MFTWFRWRLARPLQLLAFFSSLYWLCSRFSTPHLVFSLPFVSLQLSSAPLINHCAVVWRLRPYIIDVPIAINFCPLLLSMICYEWTLRCTAEISSPNTRKCCWFLSGWASLKNEYYKDKNGHEDQRFVFTAICVCIAYIKVRAQYGLLTNCLDTARSFRWFFRFVLQFGIKSPF